MHLGHASESTREHEAANGVAYFSLSASKLLEAVIDAWR